jgi:hypothetical protein
MNTMEASPISGAGMVIQMNALLPFRHPELEGLVSRFPLPPEKPDAAWEPEEVLFDLPYSSVREWVRLLEGQFLFGKSPFQGPPGLRDQVVDLLTSLAPERAAECRAPRQTSHRA